MNSSVFYFHSLKEISHSEMIQKESNFSHSVHVLNPLERTPCCDHRLRTHMHKLLRRTEDRIRSKESELSSLWTVTHGFYRRPSASQPLTQSVCHFDLQVKSSTLIDICEQKKAQSMWDRQILHLRDTMSGKMWLSEAPALTIMLAC